ncbi:UNVERIFIED_ORG: TRAP-type C4-dicarboxylate transport system substrate-binding protein [Burkholderia sp. 1595]|uniref:TRAP-type C4-dicarboxylate transport system substrate-binding protein n=1 Tax=Paraburkholderia terricola TaxID=169427 RepID=A0ABU1LZI4_9BURK|nr:TRAP transporter substrate-binding protein DctP [Paraburkholderia terricola]MDR6412161.1 TRAP-type C4-dicarboxylate transport system substrate-binding protein [Paraburkholderia terricola]
MIWNKLVQLTTDAALAVALVCGAMIPAAHAGQTWSIATEYPADTVAGRGVESFAAALSRETGGAVTGKTEFKAKHEASNLVSAVLDDRLQVADVFTGALADLDPIFELSTLPFEVQSVDESRHLACLAEPAYRKALSRAGLHLLFISPWPPTGLWSRQPIATTADMASLRIRTYDAASATVLSGVGAHAAALPVQDVRPLLRTGALDGVLSSGDGAVGKSLQTDLPNFAAIHYAFPVSFVVVSQARYEALPEHLRHALDKAGAVVQQEQWAVLPARIERNYAEMRRAGVAVNTSIDDTLRQRFHEVGQARLDDWVSRVPPDESEIITRFRVQGAPSAQNACPLTSLEAVHYAHKLS